MQKLERRWERRQTGTKALTLQSVVPITAPLTGDSVIRSFRLPGTPSCQPGEQRCVVYEVGGQLTAQIAELVVVEPPSRIVTHWLTMPGEVTNMYLLDAKRA